ncbi:FAD/NAD(P)-binding domain-containing protein [Setomelanomma holmii]|uniref:FAD/NAD(P)-binding domain-containing protein n=1 Tax=Setomelanomma holmii TaxID=210430 RepID=A0A9P4HJ45_9PLEO|nr:FAD/NAD(P)-binding domain-containing protein [Setomelanomma holmii]
MIPKIAIIGAGPGGSMLARLLHVQNIHCTIFEGETSMNVRAQGGTLDLRAKTGLLAIKEAGLWDTFQQHARYDGEALLVTDKNLTTWMRRSQGAPDQKRSVGEAPEIDRSDLRNILLQSIPKECIRWGMKLAHVEESGEGCELHFSNGDVERGYDLIIGCDGAFSKTRTLLSSEQPFYTGLGGWTMQIPDAKTNAPDIYKFVNRGSVFAYSDGKSMSIQQLSSGNIWVSTYRPRIEEDPRASDLKVGDLASVKKELMLQYKNWAPELQAVLLQTQGDAVWRSLYMLPVGFIWPHKKGITLLGDAAHLMTPFAGIGVNTAFYDALLLSREIVKFTTSKQQSDLDDHVMKYEKEMFKHAHEAQALTYGCMKDMFLTKGAPRTTIESWILRHAKADMPAWSHPFLTVLAYTVFWVYKWFV